MCPPHRPGALRARADVPADRAEELLDDLEEHLAEVAADDDAPLQFRLGSPDAYASELRIAAGLPAAPEARGGGGEVRAGAAPRWPIGCGPGNRSDRWSGSCPSCGRPGGSCGPGRR